MTSSNRGRASSPPASTPTSSRGELTRRLGAAALAAGVLLAGCAGGDDDGAAPPVTTSPSTSTSAASASTTEPAASTSTTAPVWVVGATPLPLRPDGYGEIQPTPAPLVDRRLPTTDRLPRPASGAFESSIVPIDDDVRARMGGTWQEGCPVALDELRYLTVSFVGFDGRPHTGELVVHESVAGDVVEVFHQLFDAGFPIEEMRLVTDADLAAPPTGDGNNTAAFVCRVVRGGSTFSAHASGLAIDVDPFQNPYQTDDVVLPELASAYTDRSNVRPGMIFDGDAVVTAFESIGWTWGGPWDDPVDRMHFTATGH